MSEIDVTRCSTDSCSPQLAPGDLLAALRILDANFNRATEGLRVVEEYCRFVLADRHLTELCKQLRHDLTSVIARVPPALLQAARETQRDVGTTVTTNQEGVRSSPAHVAAASWQRIEQALRTMEEYGKLLAGDIGRQCEQLRYRAYTLAKACTSVGNSQNRLSDARLYVLIDGCDCESKFVERVQGLIAGGVHIIQLRDKQLTDRMLLDRARLLKKIIDESVATARQEPRPPATHHSPLTKPLLIVNDRPDIAVLARADGVHVGQEELTVQSVRQVVGPEMLVGVSTHSIEQARQAVLDGASYLGCGPTFPSGTKQFNHFPGLEFLRQVADEISLPAFAIGGITHENLPQVLATGFRRIAVGGAISAGGTLREQAEKFLTALEQQE